MCTNPRWLILPSCQEQILKCFLHLPTKGREEYVRILVLYLGIQMPRLFFLLSK